MARRLLIWAEDVALVSIIACLLGIGAMAWAAGGAKLAGLGFMLAGLAGIGSKLRRAHLHRVERRRALFAEERRRDLRAARRKRADEARRRRAAEMEARAGAMELEVTARRERRNTRIAASDQAAGERAAQARRIEREALRLSSLSEAELHHTLEALLDARGWSPEPADSDYPGDFLLRNSNGACLLRCVPVGRSADSRDVEALEAWRQQAGACCAYLVSTSGFLPSAVAVRADLPITLAEPYLLAQWQEQTN